jgi:hypothetical protein
MLVTVESQRLVKRITVSFSASYLGRYGGERYCIAVQKKQPNIFQCERRELEITFPSYPCSGIPES